MKDKSVFFNPIRMLSPRLDSEALRLEELHKQPVSESFTLEEGLLVMLSKLIEASDLIVQGFVSDGQEPLDRAEALGKEVHQQEKLLTASLACSLSVPPEICRGLILFPSHLERVGDYLESIINCCRIKSRDNVPFSEPVFNDITNMLKTLRELLHTCRDAIATPEKSALVTVVANATDLDRMCQELQLSHVDRLLEGSTAPRSSSVYLDILESTQSAGRHVKDMMEKLLTLVSEE